MDFNMKQWRVRRKSATSSEREMYMYEKTYSEVMSLVTSSPLRIPAYYMQSLSQNSHDGEKTATMASFHSTPVLSPAGLLPHSHYSSPRQLPLLRVFQLILRRISLAATAANTILKIRLVHRFFKKSDCSPDLKRKASTGSLPFSIPFLQSTVHMTFPSPSFLNGSLQRKNFDVRRIDLSALRFTADKVCECCLLEVMVKLIDHSAASNWDKTLVGLR
ncbi:hypothetical protein Acr_05g0004830 [Actinidia rufa]|uniref:Uncharacterized protein n=1 Tax=Actinidia rufa TaxID=165716 RepID=A0A7J0EK59_9ERIC|nr:hypothetical protein Acr_05g0004830 [Actinidia rufa]